MFHIVVESHRRFADLEEILSNTTPASYAHVAVWPVIENRYRLGEHWTAPCLALGAAKDRGRDNRGCIFY